MQITKWQEPTLHNERFKSCGHFICCEFLDYFYTVADFQILFETVADFQILFHTVEDFEIFSKTIAVFYSKSGTKCPQRKKEKKERNVTSFFPEF